ncbi:hypothetical protein BGZ76_001111 [Entomortierella beljakovae]|nr:hypothetical protein BGZ76_001111 [Entomortierella beljakovae]
MQSLMVYPTSNDFFQQISNTMLDDSVAKYIPMESYLTSTSTSQDQDALMTPFYQQNQRQHHLQFSASTALNSMVPQSAPSSPPFPIKTEEPQQGVDVYLFPNSYDSNSPVHVLPNQRSPQMQYPEVSIIQQRQHHQQQLQKHDQQLRMQHQLQQQQMIYETTHSTATSMSIPATTSIMASMASTSSPNTYAPSTVATSAPFYQSHDDSHTVPNLPYQRQGAYASAHPAAPKRKIEERQTSPQLSLDESFGLLTYPPTIKSIASSRPSTSSRIDKVKTTRSTKVTKKSTKKDQSRESSEQPENTTECNRPATGNITHPRRAAQNRQAQRTFRNRRKAYIKELEQKVQDMDRTCEVMELVYQENQEVRKRLQVLESLVSQSGLQLPSFPPLAWVSSNELMNGNNLMGNPMVSITGMGSSNDEDEDEDDLSDFSARQQMH